MSSLKQLFQMSRRERRGTIVILAAVAVLLAGTQVYRSCVKDTVPPLQATEINQFEVEADTTTLTVGYAKKDAKKHHPKRSSSRRKSPKGPRPEKPARRLDPVPQF